MECKHCGAVWNADVKIEYPSKCPFCGTDVSYRGLYDGADILQKIILQYGLSILNERKRLSALLADLLVGKPKELVVLRLAAGEGIGEYFYRAKKTDEIGRNAQISRASLLLTDTLGISESRTQLVIHAFSSALGFISKFGSRDYHDADNGYYNLAREYDRKGNRKIAMALYRVSAEAGNENAIAVYVHKIHKNWRTVTDENTWYKWNRTAMDAEFNRYHNEAREEVLLLTLYGIGTQMDLKGAAHELYFFGHRNPRSDLELAVRTLCDLTPKPGSVRSAFLTIEIAAEDGLYFGPVVQELIEGDFDRYCFFENDPYSRKQELQAEIGYRIGKWFIEQKETRKALFWLAFASREGNEEAGCAMGRLFLDSENADDRKRGLEILVNLDIPEARLEAAKVYQKGNVVQRDLEKAYEILCSYNLPEFILMRAKACFYGLGCDADIRKATGLFEKYLQDTWDRRDNQGIFESLPFLIECLYEDLLDTDNIDSLVKLQKLAEYHDVRLAQQYLARYYRNEAGPYRDQDEADKYKNLYLLNKKRLFPEDAFTALTEVQLHLNMVQGMISYQTDAPAVETLLHFQDHLLQEIERQNGFQVENGEGKETSADQIFLCMAQLLIKKGEGYARNLLRAEIYVQNYLESDGIQEDSTNYAAALLLYSRILRQSNDMEKLLRAEAWAKIAAEYGEEECDEYILLGELKLTALCHARGDKQGVVDHLKKAVEAGYHGDYSLIGMLLIAGGDNIETDRDEGFLWGMRFYTAYENGELDLADCTNLAQLEFALGFWHLAGNLCEEEIDEGLMFWRKAIYHAKNTDTELLCVLGECFRDGHNVVNGEKIYIEPEYSTAVFAFHKAAQFGNREGWYLLGKMYESGRGVKRNTTQAAECCRRAAYMGHEAAARWLRKRGMM